MIPKRRMLGHFDIDKMTSINSHDNLIKVNLLMVVVNGGYLGYKQALKLMADIIQEGIDINHVNSWGRTALFEVMVWDQPEPGIKLLLDAGINMNILDNSKRPALEVMVP